MSQLDPQRVAANIRAECARHRVRQRPIAERLGLTQSAVARRLAGQVEWSATELAALADLLGVPVTELLGEVPA